MLLAAVVCIILAAMFSVTAIEQSAREQPGATGPTRLPIRPKRAAARQACFVGVELRSEWGTLGGVLVDISRDGAQIGPLTIGGPGTDDPAGWRPEPVPGSKLRLNFSGGGAHPSSLMAEVVWSRWPSVGVSFDPPLDRRQVEALLDA
jgi:hypothetical protein